jgi:CRISPR-associated endonuclease/helicase Cas3
MDIARRAGMDERTIRVFEWVGRWHDAGKRRDIWQRAAGNIDGSASVAKTESLNPRALDGYRHELGSLIDVEDTLPDDFTSDEKDLARHLIASHHGWARPHFPERAFDKRAYRVSQRVALETARRFARLQRQHGAWRLAYLESLFRSADAIVSSGTTEFANA